MENMLQNFYNLCGGDYIQAIVLNNLYHEARQHVRGGDYSMTIDLAELGDHIGFKFCTPEYLMHMVFIQFGEGMDRNGKPLLIYGNDAVYQSTTKFECIINIEEIENRLEECANERSTVERNNRRAEDLGLPATLTLAQWMGNLHLYQWKCAYCLDNYEVLEHIVPLTFPDSGTTKLNCVPACKKCNSLKGPYHPDRMPQHIKKKMCPRIHRVVGYMTHIYGNRRHMIGNESPSTNQSRAYRSPLSRKYFVKIKGHSD